MLLDTLKAIRPSLWSGNTCSARTLCLCTMGSREIRERGKGSMPVALESNAFFWGIEYLATFCCGMCGGLAAVRKGYDIFAILVTTWLTA